MLEQITQIPNLKPKHIAFINEYLQTNDKTQAYLKHCNPNITKESAAVNGSKLLRSDKTRQYIQAITPKTDVMSAQELAPVMSKSQVAQAVMELYENAKKSKKLKDALQALDMVNKMYNYYSAETADITHYQVLIQRLSITQGAQDAV